MSWLCNCGLINGGTNKHCAASRQKSSSNVLHYQVSANTSDWIMAAIAAKELSMSNDEELYAKFYNKSRIQVAAMTDIELHEHIDLLQQIAFEAKANLQGAMDERRERNAKKVGKEWLVSNDRAVQTNVSDAIKVVEKRKARMSKMDKLEKQLRDAGLDESTIREMTRNLEAKATDSTLKTIVFKTQETELKAVQIESNEPKPVFDATKLKFGGE